jgi:hypothetical protein
LALCCLRLSGVAEPAAVLVDAYDRGDINQRIRLLPVLGRVGGPCAEKTICAALADQEPAVRAAAVRGLANWPDAAVADQLLQLARHADTPAQQVWALRGYIRVVTLPGVRASEQTVKMLQEAWQLATRDEERRLILQRLPAVVCPEALAMTLMHLHDPELSTESMHAAAQLAEALLPLDPPAARHAMSQILDVCQDPAIRARLSRHVSQEP